MIDPFPPPSSGVCEAYGFTAYYAHKLERELKMFLLACHELGRFKVDLKDFKCTEDFMVRKSLGQLFHFLTQQENKTPDGPDKGLHDLLADALKNRNHLMHNLFQNYEPLKKSHKDEAAVLKQLGEIRLSIGNAFLVMRELRKKAEMELGFTEEQLNASLNKLERENSSPENGHEKQ
jgi:hypothetical protein